MPMKFKRISSVRLNLEEDKRPYLFVRIFDGKEKGLMDSGAESSIMNENLYNQLKETEQLTLHKCNVFISTADGTSHKALGYVEVPYVVKKIKRVIPTLVVRQSSAKLILGIDFWNAFRIRPCFIRNTYGINVIEGSTQVFSDPNDAHEPVDFLADVTPPKCINIELPHELTEKQKSELKRVTDKFPFCNKEGILNLTPLKVAKINTGDAEPTRCKLRIEPPWKQKMIVEEIERLEKRGIVRRVESSEWLHPVLAVPKPNGKWRICLDARALNAVTKRNCYPQQNANRILSLVGKAKYISTIDMTDAYFQIGLHPDSQEKTAFAVPTKGTYVYNRLAMGLTNSGADLCALIDSLFGSEFEPHVFPYIDDIVIVSETFEEHLEYLEKVAKKFEYANLTISAEKSKFCYRRLKYLGHIIDEEGVAMDKSRVEAIEKFPTPRNTKDIQRLIGLAGWYRRFIQDFAEITAPITELLKKKVRFEWNEERQAAFQKLIQALISAPVLAPPDYNLPFEIQADASKRACGAVLVQHTEEGEKVIAYMSQKFTATQQKYHVTELECLAVILAIEKFRPYIEGSKFRVITDHHSLLWLKNLKDPNGRLARWSLRLQAYDFTLVHRKGKHHVVPDALSRCCVVDINKINETEDEWYQNLKKSVENEPQNNDNLKIINDALYIRTSFREDCHDPNCLWRLCVPKEFRAQVMRENHDEDTSCHFGRFKTTEKIRLAYYWPKMVTDVAKYVQNCEICKLTKPHNQILTPPAGSFVEATRPWRVIATDIVGPLPMSRAGHRFLLVAVDIFSKFTIIKPVRNSTAKAVTDFIKNDVVLKFACPEIIISDNGVQYKSNEFRNFAASKGIHLWYTANYFAQANSSECVNKTIGNALRAFLVNDADHRHWDQKVQEIANAINNSVHTGTKLTPFEANFGQRMAQHADEYRVRIDANVPEKRDQESFEKMREKIQIRLKEARNVYINRYNLRTRKIDYKVGDIVYRENTILSDASKYISKKLSKKRIKCEIIGRTGANTYLLKECDSGKTGIFHAQKFCK